LRILAATPPVCQELVTAAFDNAHECLPAEFKKSEHARRKLALLILRHVERGEHNPSRLAETAVLDFLR
jgi:methylmalonyl-CoA mutase N-terminal domain/subunit